EATVYAATPVHPRSRSTSHSVNYSGPGLNANPLRSTPAHQRNFFQRNLIPKKTRSQIRLEKELAEREANLRCELSTKFKANPVPASTLIPRYHSIIKKNSTKAAEVRKKRVQELISQSKPFSFLSTGGSTSKKKNTIKQNLDFQKFEGKIKNKKVSKTINRVLNEIYLENKKNLLKQKNLEKDHHLTEEEFKKTDEKILIDSKTLDLKKFCLANKAADDGIKRNLLLKEKAKVAGVTKDHTFKPKINKVIPDYTKLREDFEQKKSTIKRKPTT
ncbi:hypothetical protein HDU92_000866, partial [Lobulomyces angularis]